MTKRRTMRRAGFAGMTAAVALSGISFGLTPAMADDPSIDASGGRVTGKLVLQAGTSGNYWGMKDGGHNAAVSFAVGTKTAAESGGTVFTLPAVGGTGEVRSASGQCLTDLGNVHYTVLRDCDDSTTQRWTVTSGGMLSTEDGRTPGGRATGAGYLWVTEPGASVWKVQSDLLAAVFGAQVVSTDIPARTADLAGSAKPGSTVILDDTIEVPVGEDGAWSYTMTGLKLGKTTVKVEQYEGPGDPTGSTTVEIDLAVTALSATASFVPDVAQEMAITGVAHPGAEVQVWQGEKMLKSVVAADITGRFSAEIAAPNAGGAKTYTVKQVIDHETAPDTMEVTAAYGQAVTIETPVNDKLHDGGPLRFQGRGEAGAKITLREAGKPGVIDTATVLANGIWTIDAASIPNKEATYEITSQGKGNNLTKSQVKLNPGVSIEKLEVLAPAAGAKVAAGKVTFTGTANVGAKIELVSKVSGSVLGSGVADEHGNWSADVNRDLGAGDYVIKVRNGATEVDRAFTVEKAVADRLDVITPAHNGEVAPGTVTFTGTANPGATVNLVSIVTGAPLGHGVAGADGKWSANVNKSLSNGAYTIRVVNGEKIVDRSFTVAPPKVGSLEVLTPAAGTPAAAGTVTFTGTANAGAKIELRSVVTGAPLGEGVANAAGEWSTEVNKPLVAGDYTIKVKNGTLEVDHTFQVR